MPRTDDADRWIRRFHPAPDAGTRLVCLPHAGGSASFYFPVSRALSPSLDVLAVQYPGRQDRMGEPPVGDLDELADRAFAALSGWLDRPAVLFGHSLGATVGFEVARRMQATGRAPVALVVSARRAPSVQRPETVHLRSDDGLLAELTGLSGTDPRLLGDPDLLRAVLPVLRSDYRAAETYRYRPGPRLTCPVTALTGDEDPKVTLDEARAWGGHTDAGFEFHVFAGGHFYLASHQDAVLDIVRRHAGCQAYS
jgi:surfactin synthase thioesterase subunit